MQVKKFIALDFDGVICDSKIECYSIAVYLFNEIRAKCINPSIFIDENFSILKELRPLVYSGEDYFYIVLSIIDNKPITDLNSLNECKKDFDIEDRVIAKKFYETRSNFREKNLDEWCALNPLFPSIKEKLVSLISRYNIIIVTTKDRSSVEMILKYNNIEHRKIEIFGRELLTEKNQILCDFINDRNINYMPFLEDRVETLLDINVTKIGRFLADWGYHNQNQKRIALKNNIAVASLTNFDFLLTKDL